MNLFVPGTAIGYKPFLFGYAGGPASRAYCAGDGYSGKPGAALEEFVP